MIDRFFKAVDNSPLIIFRIIFGFLVACECWGAILTGWVKRVLVDTCFNFHFIPFSFLHPLPGNGMYLYFFVMGALGIAIMLGYRYVLATITFCLLWGGVYFMQKSAYNNHYYLLWLLSILMVFLPAHKDVSLDVKQNRVRLSNVMPSWVLILIIGQLFLVYTYASVAKLYPDWLNTTVPARLMAGKANYPLIGELLQQTWAHYVITYVGILFDLLIIPALLWKPTRKIAFAVAVFFHIYNSIVLQIGIFPYLALGFTVFFFPASKIRKWFYPKHKKAAVLQQDQFAASKFIVALVSLWLLVQLCLPIRHWFIDGDVLWTEEGHRLSWRMMLRSKSGYTIFKTKEAGGRKQKVRLEDYLTNKQINSMVGKPDMIWQFAQYLKDINQRQGKPVEVYVDSWVGVNGGKRHRLIDANEDIANQPWTWWKHNCWVLLPSVYIN